MNLYLALVGERCTGFLVLLRSARMYSCNCSFDTSGLTFFLKFPISYYWFTGLLGLDHLQAQQTLKRFSTGPQWLKLWAIVIYRWLFLVEFNFYLGQWRTVSCYYVRVITLSTSESSLLFGFKLQFHCPRTVFSAFYPSRQIQWNGILILCLVKVPGTLSPLNLQEIHSASCSVCIKKISVDN